VLDVLFCGPKASLVAWTIAIFDQEKIFKKYFCIFFLQFLVIQPKDPSRIHLKCWIRIRIQLIRYLECKILHPIRS
jgi:hypothetical protein